MSSQAFEDLKDLIESCAQDLLKAGVAQEQIHHALDYRVDHGALLPVLGRIVQGELRAWRDVRAEVDECVWEWYEASSSAGKGQVEWERHKAASKVLRQAWRQRVAPFWKEAQKRARA